MTVRSGDLSGPITFVAPLPGLGEHTAFTLTAVDGTDDLFTLTADASGDGNAPRLFLLDPGAYFLDYAPSLPKESLRELSGTPDSADDEASMLVVVHPADATLGPTANLLAPVVIHPRTRRARQIVLDGTSWPLRAPL